MTLMSFVILNWSWCDERIHRLNLHTDHHRINSVFHKCAIQKTGRKYQMTNNFKVHKPLLEEEYTDKTKDILKVDLYTDSIVLTIQRTPIFHLDEVEQELDFLIDRETARKIRATIDLLIGVEG